MTIPVMIADDEAPARRKLARFLESHHDLELVAEASSGLDAVDLARMTKPRIVFLDIHMPDLDGLGVAETLVQTDDPPSVVFVTAFDEYAVRAFDVAAIDYLHKPYDRERFERALDRARRSLEATGGNSLDLGGVLASARAQSAFATRLLASENGRSFFIPVHEIRRIESDGNNVVIHASRGTHTLRATLESIEARLDPAHFARVHRSHIVNIDDITEINAWFHGDYKLMLRDGTELGWSRRYASKRPDLLK